MKTRLALSALLLTAVLAACGASATGAPPVGNPTAAAATSAASAPAGNGKVDCAKVKAAAVELIVVQFLAQLNTPDTIAAIKAKQIGNLDLDKFLAAMHDLHALDGYSSGARRPEGGHRRLRDGRQGREGALRRRQADAGRHRHVQRQRRDGHRVPRPPGRDRRGDGRGRLLTAGRGFGLSVDRLYQVPPGPV